MLNGQKMMREENTLVRVYGHGNADIYFLDKHVLTVRDCVATVLFNPNTLHRDHYKSVYYMLVHFLSHHRIMSSSKTSRNVEELMPPWFAQNDVVRGSPIVEVRKGTKMLLPQEYQHFWWSMCQIGFHKGAQAVIECGPEFKDTLKILPPPVNRKFIAKRVLKGSVAVVDKTGVYLKKRKDLMPAAWRKNPDKDRHNMFDLLLLEEGDELFDKIRDLICSE